MKQKLFVAGKALIVRDGKILLLQEDSRDPDHVNAGKWDVPGGRLNFGEHPLDGLMREAKEETGLSIEMERPFFVDHWQPQPYPDEAWQIVGMYYICRALSDDIVLSHEHKNYAWVAIDDLVNYEMVSSTTKALEAYKKDLT